MTGIQLPTPPTDRSHDPDHPPIAADRAVPQAAAAATRSLLLTVAVILLGVAVVVLGVILLLTAADRAELRAENERLAADNAELVTTNEELTAGLRGWEEEFLEPEWFELGDPVALFATDAVEQLSIDGAARYAFVAEPGHLLEVVLDPSGGDGFVYLELVDDRGRFVGFADIGSFPDAGWYGHVPRDHAWFILDRDGSYELTVHGEGRYGPNAAPTALTAQLHALTDGTERVVDVSEPYPIDGELPIQTFEGRAGQLAIITMTSERPEALDPFVRLYGPTGALVGQDDDGAGGLDARLVVLLPEDGRYEVEADTFDGGWSRRPSREHPYTLTVELVDLG